MLGQVQLISLFVCAWSCADVSAFAPLGLPQRHAHPSIDCQVFHAPPRHGQGHTTLSQLRNWRSDLENARRGRLESFFWKKTRKQLKLSAAASPEATAQTNQLDGILSRLTSAFPFFVLGSAILGLTRPSTLMWTNRGTLISWMLASVMCATGLTLEKKDFTKVLNENLGAVPAGVLCQFLIMPLTAMLIGRKLLLNAGPYGPSLFLGLCLVGCSPGGTASNLVSLIAKADVALSVLLTSCSTILASIVTPILVKFMVGSTIQVSGWTLCEATARVVLLPVMFGMFINTKAPNLAAKVSRFTPFASVLLVSMICGGVVSQNASLFLESSSLIPLIVGSVLSLHCVGFLVGYLVPRLGLGLSEMSSRTISIETGMQNSALAVVLARSIGAPPVASLPGALSATAHSCLGSVLAGYWHGRQQVDDAQDLEESEPNECTDSASQESDTALAIEPVDTPVEVVNGNVSADDECVIEEEMTKTDKLMKQVKDSGVAGVISYALWELGFWTISVPVCLIGYQQVAGHWPDLSDKEDLQKLGAEAFAFVNFARFAVPLRIGLALGTVPWIQKNIVDRFMKKDEENICEPIEEED